MSEFLGILIKTHAIRFLSCPAVHNSLIPKLLEMSDERCLVYDRKFACLVLDDILEFGLEDREIDVSIRKSFIDRIVDGILGGIRSFVRSEDAENTIGVTKDQEYKLLLAATHGCLVLMKQHSDLIDISLKREIKEKLGIVIERFRLENKDKGEMGNGGDFEEAMLNALETIERIENS